MFLTLRRMFQPLGIDLEWLALVEPSARSGVGGGTCIECPAPNTVDGTRRLLACLEGGYDGAVVNVFAEVAMMNASRFLPADFPRILHVHSTSRATIAVAGALAPHAQAIVAPSPAVAELLRGDARVPLSALHLIPHANPVEEDAPRSGPPEPGQVLRLAYLGRIKDEDRGVLMLPAIMEECRRIGLQAACTVAGDGPDLPALRSAAQRVGGLDLIGEIPPDQVPGFLARHQFLISPANFEGFGLSVLEAMSVGCVPIATRLMGVTDWLLDGGQCGGLFERGDARGAAALIRENSDPHRWSACSSASIARARGAHAQAVIGVEWHKLLQEITSPVRPVRQVPIGSWDVAAELRPNPLSSILPTPVKSALRRLRR